MGGGVEASSPQGGGAVFTLRLPKVPEVLSCDGDLGRTQL
jgi:signal transduction histidine kinase